eukprot:5340862-Amphidinium_carterae.2
MLRDGKIARLEPLLTATQHSPTSNTSTQVSDEKTSRLIQQTNVIMSKLPPLSSGGVAVLFAKLVSCSRLHLFWHTCARLVLAWCVRVGNACWPLFNDPTVQEPSQ